MTLGEIKYQVLFQSNNDPDDLGDFMPHIDDYVNDGYDRMLKAWDHAHVGTDTYPTLLDDSDTPLTPEWTHRYLADWATWLVYRNGNPQKQNRGYPFRESFERALSQITSEGGTAGLKEDGTQKRYKYFINIPT